jgi:hypothetical protein
VYQYLKSFYLYCKSRSRSLMAFESITRFLGFSLRVSFIITGSLSRSNFRWKDASFDSMSGSQTRDCIGGGSSGLMASTKNEKPSAGHHVSAQTYFELVCAHTHLKCCSCAPIRWGEVSCSLAVCRWRRHRHWLYRREQQHDDGDDLNRRHPHRHDETTWGCMSYRKWQQW